MPSTAMSILDGLSTSVAVKAPCRTVATSNIALSGLQTISGYTTVEDDRVLVKGQTDPVDNGIWMASTGSWTRAKDADGNRDLVQGTRVLVRSTAIDGVEYELTTANPIVIGTTELTFTLRYGANATYDQTEAEIAAGVTPTSYAKDAGLVERYATNTTPGTTDMAAALTAANAQAAAGGAPITATTVLHIGSSVTITGPFVAAPNKQIFSATSTVVFAAGSVPCVYPEWWGTGVGTIQTARTAVSGKYIPVVLLSRSTPYQFATKLAITDDGAEILGVGGTNDTEGGVYAGPVLEYTGTSGTAIEVGNAPDTNGNFISKVRLEGFILKVHENTDIALRGWHLGGRSVIRDITVRGNSDKDASENTGMKFEGCIDTVVERCIVFGQGTAATAAGYLNQGIWIKNGFSNSPTTTFDLIHPYVTQCQSAYRIDDDSTVNMITPVGESCYNAGLIALNAKVHLITPHLEDNGSSGTAAIRLQGASCSLSMDGGSIDIGANETFISCEADCTVSIISARLASSHGTPVLIGTGGNNPTVSILGNNVFPAGMIDWEAAYAGSSNKLLKYSNGILQGMTLYGLNLRVATQTPASAAATGTTGTIAWDGSFLYVCTSTNAWKRVAIATW